MQWDLASLVDLEIAVTQEKSLADTDLKARDRAFYQRYRAEGGAVGSRSQTLRAWVEVRRGDSAQATPTPGQEAQACVGWIKSLGSMATFLLGSMWAWGALTLHGAPVNVLTFWFLTIGIPLLLTAAGFYLLMGWRLPRGPHAPMILKRLLARLVVSGVLRSEHFLTDRIGSDREAALRAHGGELRARFADRHGLIAAILANTLHVLGLGMVLGIFAALFVFKNFSNQDYGWQSDAACVTAGRVDGFVGLIAMPWTRVLGRDAGQPSSREIERTRFLRNEGVKGIDHAASINWSSFLVFSSLFWGVLPRVLLCVAGRVAVRRRVQAEDFSQHRFDALWRRMENPDITMAPSGSVAPGDACAAAWEPDTSQGQAAGLLLLPQELASDKLRQNVVSRLAAQHGHSPHQVRALPALPGPRTALVDQLASGTAGNRLDLLILQEAFMPPVREFREFLLSCRAKLGGRCSLRVVLIGARTGDGTWAAPTAQDRAVWQERIAAIGDARISVLTLNSAAAT